MVDKATDRFLEINSGLGPRHQSIISALLSYYLGDGQGTSALEMMWGSLLFSRALWYVGGFSLARSTLGIWTQSCGISLGHDEEHFGFRCCAALVSL